MREQYVKEIAEQNSEYRTSIADFTEWLIRNNMIDTFTRDLKSDDYEVAVDFSIPVSMVKYFRGHKIA